MGNDIIISNIEFLDYRERKLYQIDLYNKTKNEWYRVFEDCKTLEKMLKAARKKKCRRTN